jgi:DNA repair protein RadA/Sms
VFGEVGLSGEVRHVSHADKRLAEAKKLGFAGAIGPQQKTAKKLVGLHGVSDVRQALNQFLEKD